MDADGRPKKRPLDEADAGAALGAQVAVESCAPGDVVVVLGDLAGGHRAGELHDPIVGMDDHGHVAPAADIGQHVDEGLAGANRRMVSGSASTT